MTSKNESKNEKSNNTININHNNSDISETSNYNDAKNDIKNKVDFYHKIFELKNKEYIHEIEENFVFLENETKLKTKGVALLTNYCFRFKEWKNINQQKNEVLEDKDSKVINNYHSHIPSRLFKIPYFLISNLEKSEEKLFDINTNEFIKNHNNSGNRKGSFSNQINTNIIHSYFIEIITKDNRNMKFFTESNKPYFYDKLNQRAFPKKSNKEFYIFAEEYAKSDKFSNIKINGWNIYDVEEEFKRQNLDENLFVINRDLNKNYSLCQSYPEILVVPNSFPVDKIADSSNFRTRNRLPVVCYYNNTHKNVLLRSSQVKTGLFFSRSDNDEKYLESFRKEDEILDIYDARPYINAFSMKVS